MSQDGLVNLIAVSLAVMVMLWFWRQLLLLMISLLLAVFCLGLYHMAQLLHHYH